MNYYAAKYIGFDYPIEKNEIFINKDTLTKTDIIKTIIHEIVESAHMAKGEPYWNAHKMAAEAEKKPYNIEQISSLIDKIHNE